MHTFSTRRAAAVTSAALALALGLAACGGDDSDTASTPSSATGGSTASNAPAGDGVAEAARIVAQYRQPPAWQGPDAPVAVGALKGKRVVYISVNDAIPVLKYWSGRVTELLTQYGGVTMNVVDAKGSVDAANKGFQQAIATKVDAVVIQALPASLFAAQISQAKAAGIKVVIANAGTPGDVSGGVDAAVSFDYVQVGKLIGDWMVADSQGKGKGLVITSDDVPASQPQAQGTLSEVKRLCPACNMKTQDVQIPQWEASIPTLFQTTVNSDPERKYLLPLYDGQALSGLGALRTANRGDKVAVGAFNATPGIVEQLKDAKSGLKLDIGGQNEWWAYAATDQIFRVLSGTTPIGNYNIGLRIFDSSNADLIQGKDEFTWYASNDYTTKFPALWKTS
ncbi:MAG TPA: substrate-binding domain-containing protein [Mycobacteriales bacterium]|jgi:ABC-type sugar transport system substrate-binding protein|nr:substrate-binding domain-containing protein [Mycobacteriales bacterium]